MFRPSNLPIALCGIIGPAILVASFVTNLAPPTGSTAVQLRDFGVRHHDGIVLGAWLQGMGSLLIVLFTIVLVHLAGATQPVIDVLLIVQSFWFVAAAVALLVRPRATPATPR